MGQPVGALAEQAAPAVFDLHVTPLREHRGDAPRQEALPAFLGGRRPGHAAGPAHVQAVVGQQAEIGEHRPGVVEWGLGSPAVGLQFAGGQRPGCHDLGDRRKQGAVDRRVQAVAGEAVGRDQHPGRRHAAPRGGQAVAAVLAVPAGDHGMAVDHRAVTLRQAGQFPRVLQRVQAEAIGKRHAAVDMGRGETPLEEVLAREQLAVESAQAFPHRGGVVQARPRPRRMGDAERAVALHVDVEGVGRGEVAHQLYGLALGRDVVARDVLAELAGDGRGIESCAAEAAVAAVASRGAPARRHRLQHAHRHAGIAHQVQGGRKPGEAAADDGDVALEIARHRVASRNRRAAGCLPVAMQRLVGVVHHGMEELRHGSPRNEAAVWPCRPAKERGRRTGPSHNQQGGHSWRAQWNIVPSLSRRSDCGHPGARS